MSERPCDHCPLRHLGERAELVERVINLDRDNRLLRRTLRELTTAANDGEPFGDYITALQARIRQLEDNIDRITRQKKGNAA